MSRAEGFIKFVNEARSEYHAVDQSRKILHEAGFVQLHENQEWKLQHGGKYYFTRNQSSLIAFSIGKKFVGGNGFNVIAAHTDSPNLKVKPNLNIQKAGFLQIGVSTYGGGLWYTWFDRDLTLAGRVFVRTQNGFESRLVFIRRPILRIPSLAIHLDRSVSEAFKFNVEDNFVPILSTSIKSQLETKDNNVNSSSLLVNLLATELGVEKENIVNFDLDVCDFQDANIGGLNNEFIFSARIDNLMSTYCAVTALSESYELDDETNCRIVVLYDNEEVGSQSPQGAESTLLSVTIQQITEYFSKDDKHPTNTLTRAIKNSFLISADMAHGLHPNYSSKHDDNHRPKFHEGVVIKINVNTRYATTGETNFYIEELAKKNQIPMQKFVVRNDSPCGTTIGPIVSSLLGMRTIDIGTPQFSMHSIREMCSVDDVSHYIRLMSAFYNQFSVLDKSLRID
jgi:aspartyl aminopeptidase